MGKATGNQIKLLSSGQKTCTLGTSQFLVVSLGKIQHFQKEKTGKKPLNFRVCLDSSVIFTSAINQPLVFCFLFFQDTALDPGEDVALLSVSFEDAEATQVFPKLYLSPSIEQYVLHIFTHFHVLRLRNENYFAFKLFAGKY